MSTEPFFLCLAPENLPTHEIFLPKIPIQQVRKILLVRKFPQTT